MAKMTQAQWQEAIDACGGNASQDQLINLVYGDGPLALWNDTVRQMTVSYDNLHNYLTGIFPTELWQDWQGTDELGKVYHPAFVPFDLSIFQRSMEICKPESMDECRTDYCDVPRGGVSNLPPLEMYRTAFKTQPLCMANIRTSKIAKQIAEMIVNERYQIEEQVKDMFYTLAMIRMIGHKWVLEYEGEGANISPVANDNPYNMLQAFRYSYMQPLFPAASNLQNIMPFDFSTMDMLGRALSNSRNPNFISKGPRNTPIFELWHTDDWYRQEMLDNPEYVERNKYTMKCEMLPGYSMAGEGTEKDIVGNFSMRQISALPKFTESTKGGLTVVQQKTTVAVESGNRSLHNYRQYDNAPFGLIVMLGKEVGKILTRPAISTGIEGRPIQPITGDGDWVYWNEYDKECNPEKNMPYFKRRFEMGFRPKNPDASWGFIHRTKKFRLRPVQTCNLNDVFKIAPSESSCSILTVGCNPLNERHDNNIIDDSAGFKKVKCSSKACGDSDNLIYTLSIRREWIDSISPGQNPLQSCECGDTVQVIIGDEDGDSAKIRNATILEYFSPKISNPNPVMIVKLASALSAGECIKAIACKDSTPTSATILQCTDSEEDDSLESGQIRIVVDSFVDGVKPGESVKLTYFDADGAEIDDHDVTVVSMDETKGIYVLEGEGLACQMEEGQVTVKMTWND